MSTHSRRAARAARRLPDVATITRRSGTVRGSSGGVSQSTTTVATGVRVRISRLGTTPQEQQLGAQLGSTLLRRARVPLGAALADGDLLTIGTNTYAVVALLDDLSHRTTITAIVRKERS
jgi:hypothetical protein